MGQQTTCTAKATEAALCKLKRHTTECDGSTLCCVSFGLAQGSFSRCGKGSGLLPFTLTLWASSPEPRNHPDLVS